MEVNMLNLAVRFILEISGLVTLGVWGWDKGKQIYSYRMPVVKPVFGNIGTNKKLK